MKAPEAPEASRAARGMAELVKARIEAMAAVVNCILVVGML